MQQNQFEPEISVEDTNAQALQAKLSAIQKGYFKDEFAAEFVKPGPKKDIIMHRGYWARQNIFKIMVEKFLQSNPEQEKQIISLGCGYDTLYFNLSIDEKYKNNKFTFYEVDLPNVVSKKVRKINNSEKCQHIFPKLIGSDPNNKTAVSENYKLFPCDLTQLKDFQEKLIKYGIDFTKPTFVFAECVLTYIDSKSTNNLLQYFQENYDFVQIMDYEMFNPTSPFGKQMVKNFELKGCPLQGIFDYTTLEAQKNRLLQELKFQNVEIYDMLNIYNKCCDQNERQRIEKLELLDEYEEWIIIQQHYFIALSTSIKNQGKKELFQNYLERVQLLFKN